MSRMNREVHARFCEGLGAAGGETPRAYSARAAFAAALAARPVYLGQLSACYTAEVGRLGPQHTS
jgi:hypothetical protein